MFPVIAEEVANIEGNILPTVGASRRIDANGQGVANRTTVDTRLIHEYQTKTGMSVDITHENQVGGFPAIDAGEPSGDSDHDGMADAWETARGLNPNDPSDRSLIAPSGYTYLEEFINGPEPADILFSPEEPLPQGSGHGSGDDKPCGNGAVGTWGWPWRALPLAALCLALAMIRRRKAGSMPQPAA